MEKIKEFLKVRKNGGDGYGFGYSYSDGYGYSDGSGYGYGNGNGDGYAYGDSIKSLNGKSIHKIDSMNTIIERVRDNIAKGYIINSDMTMTKCFVIKRNNVFAHGATVKKAHEALMKKLFNNMPTSERIDMFLEEFELDKKYKAMKFFEWHNKLTGSCEFGRISFAKNHDIDLDYDMFTVDEFVEIVKDGYASDIISELKERLIR